MAAQMIAALPHASAVVDEPAHLTAGYLAVTRGDLAVNREHPPLAKAIAALPLIPLTPPLPPEPDSPRTSEDFEFEYARRFLYGAADPHRMLARARLPIVGLSMCLALAAGLWAAPLTGSRLAGGAACLWVAFEPNLLAHGRLVTTDLAASLFALLLFAAAERACAAPSGRPRRIWIAAAGAALGLSLISRYAGVILAPLCAIGLLIDARMTRREALRALAVIGLIALAVVNAGYLLLSGEAGGSPFPLATTPVGGPLRTAPLAAMEAHPVLRWAPLGVPRIWVEGIDLARWKNAEVEGPAYLNGRIARDGWWSYFLLALAMKSTIGLILASGIGLVLTFLPRARGEEARRRRACLVWVVLPAASILLVTTALTRAQIGLRYVLPVVPFLCVLAAVPFSRSGPRGRIPGRAWPAAGALLILWHAGSALAIHPYHLAHFNALAGGAENGRRRLVDSNLDWGQDLPGLRRFMDARGLDAITLYYFGTADPAAHGIRRHVPPRAGYVAVSATHLAGVYLPDPDYFAPLRGLKPETTIGHSILVYRLDPLPAFLTSPPRAKEPTSDLAPAPAGSDIPGDSRRAVRAGDGGLRPCTRFSSPTTSAVRSTPRRVSSREGTSRSTPARRGARPSS